MFNNTARNKYTNFTNVCFFFAYRFIQGEVPTIATEEFRSINETVVLSSAEFLAHIFPKIPVATHGLPLSFLLQDTVLRLLARAITNPQSILQIHLLDLLRSIITVQVPPDVLCTSLIRSIDSVFCISPIGIIFTLSSNAQRGYGDKIFH